MTDIPGLQDDILRALGKGARLEKLSSLTGGLSGCAVWTVDVESRDFSGIAILKVATDEPAISKLDAEVARLDQVRNDSPPAFAELHIPPRILGVKTRQGTAMLISVAGDSLQTVTTLSTLGSRRLPAAFARVSSGLLSGWNADCHWSAEPLDLRHQVLAMLGESHANRLIESPEFHPEWLAQSRFAFSSREYWLPNPIHLLAVAADAPPYPFRCMLGRMHGDLHGQNILTKIGSEDAQEWFLIDFSRYNPRAPLFFDNAYLELSFLLDMRRSSGMRSWMELVTGLAVPDPEAVSVREAALDDLGLVHAVQTIRAAETDWQKAAEPNRRDPIAAQMLLARVAVGLDFAGKDLTAEGKTQAVTYAAAHLGALYKRLGYDWPREGLSISTGAREAELPSSDWQEVLRACEGFDRRRSLFGLIIGPGIREIDPKLQASLGSLPLSVVLDFDAESRETGFLTAVKDEFLLRRDLAVMTNETVREWNTARCTAFFLADGPSDVSATPREELARWRREYMPLIRDDIASALKADAPLSPVTLLVLPHGIDERKLQACLEGLDEVLGDRAKFVTVAGEGAAERAPVGGLDSKVFRIRRDAFCNAIADAFGEAPRSEIPRVPSRKTGEHHLQALGTKDRRFLEQDLEVVHAGLAFQSDPERALANDFWRGHTISWADLEAGGIDVERDLFERKAAHGKTSLEECVAQHLRHSGVTCIVLQHTPGAGGTTAARRLAWNMKERYPTAILTAVSDSTADRLAFLFHETAYPVLAIIEASVCPPARLDELERVLVRNKVSAVLVFVARSLNPVGDFALVDPLSRQEAEAFLRKYTRVARSGRVSALQRLATDPGMAQYRSPFFFGLLAFEREYVHVEEFVSGHIDDLDKTRREVLAYLALVTRYSQAGLTAQELQSLLGLPSDSRPRLTELLGEGPARLALVDEHGVRLLHPLLAEATLRLLLRLRENDDGDWRLGLEGQCVGLIEKLAAIYGAADVEQAPPVLEHLFTDRLYATEGQYDATTERSAFSELVQAIPGEGSQSRVLQTLAHCFPGNPHFHMHLGRHYMYVMEDYDGAESAIREAIDLEDPHESSVHYHALGMVFRLRAKSDLVRAKQARLSLEQALPQVQAHARAAFEAFAVSEKLAPDREHSYVTPIQLTAELIEGLFRLTPFTQMSSFWRDKAAGVDWCREILADAEELLSKLSRIHAHYRAPSSRRLDCRRLLERAYGDSAATIEVLNSMLARPDVRHDSVRRMLANAYIASTQHDWSQLRQEALERIRGLMETNMRTGPVSAHDIRRWLSAARRLPSFDSLEAIRRLENWAAREGSIEAHFYLYILRFLRWLEELTSDSTAALSSMAQCEAAAGDYGRTFLREWLSTDKGALALLESREIGWTGGSELTQTQAARLRPVDGFVRQINGPQAGFISVGPFSVFFLPGTEYIKGRDEEAKVRVRIGFSYEGIRAFNPERL